MPTLYGVVTEYGIKEPQQGILLEGVDFSWVPEWHEPKNEKGRLCGRRLVDEHMECSISGAIPLGDKTSGLRGGVTLALANAAPDLWAEKPSATTTIINDIKQSYSNSDAAKRELTVGIYAFAESVGLTPEEG